MIRINLLPFRLARKKENIRKQISIFLLLIVLTAVGLYWYTLQMNRQITTVKEQTKQVNTQISKYKEKANRVSKIKRDLKILKEKLAIVASLKKQRDKQLVLFDGMTQLIVPERMWIETLSTNQRHVTIKGIAFDNHTIADFMNNLEASPLFNKVDLKTAKLKKFKDNIMLKSFELLCQKTPPVQPKKSAEKPRKGKK